MSCLGLVNVRVGRKLTNSNIKFSLGDFLYFVRGHLIFQGFSGTFFQGFQGSLATLLFVTASIVLFPLASTLATGMTNKKYIFLKGIFTAKMKFVAK